MKQKAREIILNALAGYGIVFGFVWLTHLSIIWVVLVGTLFTLLLNSEFQQ